VALIAIALPSWATGEGPGAVSAGAGQARLPCLNGKGTKYVARVEPERCTHFGPGGAFAGGVDLLGLQWSDWGAKIATATGTECGFHVPCDNIAVTVEAFRKRARCGRRIYTRLRATSQFGSTLVKTKACLGSSFLGE
jgi:hypothetical protein